MSEPGGTKWIVFAGGVLIGTAVAGAVAYAVTRHYLEIQLAGGKQRHSSPKRRPQDAAVHIDARPELSRPSIGSEPSLKYGTPPRTLQSVTNQSNLRQVSVPERAGFVSSTAPRLALYRADVTEEDAYVAPNGAAAFTFTNGMDANGLDINCSTRTTSVTLDVPASEVSRATSMNKPSVRQFDPFFTVTPADRSNFSAMETLKNPNMHLALTPAPPTAVAAGPSTSAKPADIFVETGRVIEEAATHEDYCRVITPETVMTEEIEDVCQMLVDCLNLRKKWLFQPVDSPEARAHEPEAAVPSELNPNPLDYCHLPTSQFDFGMCDDGVIRVWTDPTRQTELAPIPGSASEFFTDMHRILRFSALGPVKSFCHHRLVLLEQKFNLHIMLNADKEFLAQKSAPHRDFYNVRKVDTHIHHSACMHQKHLLRFIKSKLRKEPGEVVIFRDGKYLTLREVFESLNLTGYDLNVDTLDMHADKNIFHRFDKFNLKYNPCGQSRLREIFIKQDNLIHGRFLAELTQEVFSDLEASKYQHAEMRISIYGRKQVEWDILASWVVGNNLYSDNVVWLIQIPRLYNVYIEQGVIENFQQMLDNIFIPLFEVTKDPASHPQLHIFLQQCVGFDMVDDESKPERRPTKHSPPPKDWNGKHNAAYAYYAYYTYANLYTLNKFREARGLNSFTFRPHAGEAGDVDHLVAAFMLCENIAHGINLRKSPCLQYLFYLAQIGLCMSPLSNNSLFLDYHRNPFPAFFARGMSVSLSTDDPLQIHLTREPLVEEYSVAAQVWKLSSTDLCEVARNGVLHSGFPHACKKHWVAEEYWKPGPSGNNIQKTNVPNLRLRYRVDTYNEEVRLVTRAAHQRTVRLPKQRREPNL